MNTNRTGWEADSNGYSTTVDNDSRVMVRDDDKGREVIQWQREGGGGAQRKTKGGGDSVRDGVRWWKSQSKSDKERERGGYFHGLWNTLGVLLSLCLSVAKVKKVHCKDLLSTLYCQLSVTLNLTLFLLDNITVCFWFNRQCLKTTGVCMLDSICNWYHSTYTKLH